MNWLAENALAIWAIGAVALTLALVVYFQTGTRNAQLAIVVVVLVTAVLLTTEWLIETPREAVARTLDEIATAVRANDMPGVLRHISPTAANLRKEVEAAMPEVKIDLVSIRGTQIELLPSANPSEAVVDCQVSVVGTVKRHGFKGGQAVAVKATFVREGDRWLVTDYKSDKDWRSAVGR